MATSLVPIHVSEKAYALGDSMCTMPTCHSVEAPPNNEPIMAPMEGNRIEKSSRRQQAAR